MVGPPLPTAGGSYAATLSEKQEVQFIGVIPYGNESHLRSDQVIRKDPAKPGIPKNLVKNLQGVTLSSGVTASC